MNTPPPGSSPSIPGMSIAEMHRRHAESLERIAELSQAPSANLDYPGQRRRILRATRDALGQLLPLETIALFLVDEESFDFLLDQCEPEDCRKELQLEIDRQIESGTFGWAVNNAHPVLVTSTRASGPLLFHVLATEQRVIGMFVGILEESAPPLPRESEVLISIAMRQTAQLLDNAAIRESLRQATSEVESIVAERTRTLRAANERLEEAGRAKTEYLVTKIREMRMPLTAITGFTELLLEDPSLEAISPERRQDLRVVLRNSKWLGEIVENITELARIDERRFEPVRQRCSPAEIAQDVVKSMLIKANEKRISLTVSVGDDTPPLIHTDPPKLRQILVNLISNGIKFTEEGHVELQVALGRSDDISVAFRVVDTGVGMTPEELRGIFEPFSQASEGTSEQFGGTGLGLTISKQLAEDLGGSIVAESEVGRGSIFTLHIPINQKVAAVKQPGGTSPNGDQDLAEMEPSQELPALDCRVLLAEYGHDHQRLIASVLEKFGATLTIVNNGAEAIQLAEAARSEGESFDFILLDLQMPIMDGYEATRLLRERGIDSSIIGLATTDGDDDWKKCVDAGCSGYVTKPIDRQEFHEILAAQLEQRRAARES
ncbi:Autoinducer 2 sensor kinase/phosphatase LuxQ [Planctomycetes bacterium Pan216]|uniref:histidine kinase n=1 Tax=Kolteria novifilia TaxID=2527975 RepID=A0A518BB75_9BACT|nr:Autoinducer 2 sensor kinase/phosphatase LuxQ [Planctomycetes bacterium Pan216]